MARILVLDDEEAISWGLVQMAMRMGHEAWSVATAEQALADVAVRRPEVIFADVRLPGMSGLAAMARFREILGNVRIVVMTAYGDLATAVEAIRNGAFEYLVKPFDLDLAERVLKRALQPVRGLPVADRPPVPAGRLVGNTPAMQDVYRRIALVADSSACVLVGGESGTGKELVARAIHEYSSRARLPFVAVNIAALAPSLIESELFGHARGAFTGADVPRMGLLAAAEGGTVFLDEIGDVPGHVQVKLLRALESGEVLPVGASSPIRVDFRLISATHHDLSARAAMGSFRHDLFFRLNTFRIDLPPLRERRADIKLLAEHFLRELGGDSAPVLSESAAAELATREWQGNVRELRNALEHATILARDGRIECEHLPAPVQRIASLEADDSAQLASAVRTWAERQLAAASGDLHRKLLALVEPPLFRVVLARDQGQRSIAAQRLGIHRMTLRKKLKDYGLN